MSITDGESTRRPAARQSSDPRWRPHAAFGRWLLLALCLAGSGCHSIYHRARATMPSDPCAQLRLRIDEARRAEALVAQAEGKLRDSLDRRLSGVTLQVDFDRLEMAAFELERRVTAARDIAKLCERQPELTSELERLRLHAQAWQDYARAARHATAEATESEGSVFDNGHSPQRLPRR